MNKQYKQNFIYCYINEEKENFSKKQKTQKEKTEKEKTEKEND